MVKRATIDEVQTRLHSVQAEHIRAFRVTDTLYRVPSVSSRVYAHPSRYPELRWGLKNTPRKWHYVTCLRLADGSIRYTCNGEHCVYLFDERGSTVCKHAIAVALRHQRHPKEAVKVIGVDEIRNMILAQIQN